ncbi:S41 family peptidase [Flagellimonas onchidii]|uniref:S41 family peptidase n=1 Tax=Flagellimonas onchidii TaxID=2562684 RepID=UPI0010A623F5|nr:S41 family peptidase [Allomuricauda onchidii]
MKKNYVLLFLTFSLFSNGLMAQILTETQKLESLCRVWGFLKYYHPQVAKGKFDWDKELLNKIPMVREAENKEELSKIYLDWIDGLGKVKPCKSCSNPSDKEYFDKNFDLSWIDDNHIFTANLSKKLRHVEANRFQGRQYYVEPVHKRVGNIALKNEPEYPDFDWSNSEMRLLIAFKYWNIIEYFFPYKYQTDIPWDVVLGKVITEMAMVQSQTDFYKTFKRLVASIDDGHAYFYPPGQTFRWSPHIAKYIEGEMVVTGNRNDSLAQFSPLQKGDIIKRVDGKPIDEIIKEKKPFVSGSNPLGKYRNLTYLILSSTNKDEKAKVEFERNGEHFEAEVSRYSRAHFRRKGIRKDAYKVLENNIGYLDLAHLKMKEVPEAMEAVSKTGGLIIDVRNYPRGVLWSLANHLSSSRNLFYMVTRPDLKYPGKFYIGKAGECGGLKREWFYSNNVVLLVNEQTQSHAEFTVMALQTGDKITTIGSQTAGADGNVSRLNLASGIRTSISGIGIFYPDGTEAQRKGVKIDIEVKPTIQGIIDGRDVVLERAISYLAEQEE